MNKVLVYFYNVGFGFLEVVDSYEGILEPSPYPYLLCVEDFNGYVAIRGYELSSIFAVSDFLHFEFKLTSNPNLKDIPEICFRKAGIPYYYL